MTPNFRPARGLRAARLALIAALLAAVPLASKADPAAYFPPRGQWERRQPGELGMDGVRLQEAIAFSIAKMKDYGIVDSGDSLTLGIGAMTDDRMKSFFDKMVSAGVVKASIDYRRAYDTRFVNKGVGLALRPKN